VHIVSGYLFVQGGNIQALGTSTAPIVFDAPNGNHPDCINVNPIGNTESVFRWCLFSNFTYALENFRKPIEITNCSFINCVRGVDIQCNGPDQEAVTITNCDFIWDDYFDGWGNAWTGIMLKRADHFGNSYLVANCRFMKTGEWPEWDHIVGLICTSIGDAVANHSHEYCTVANNHFDNTLSQGHFGMSFWAPGGWSEAPQIVNNYIGGGESVHWNDVPPPERQFARNNLVITPFGTDDIDCSGMTVFYGETQHLYIDPDRENPFLV